MAKKKIKPIHPGEVLNEEFLGPMNISQYRLAKDIGVPARRINEIVHGKRGITADTSLRLARYFDMSPEFWMNLQAHYDLSVSRAQLGKRLEKEVIVYSAKNARDIAIINKHAKSLNDEAEDSLFYQIKL